MLVNGSQKTFPHEEIRKYGCYFLTLVSWVEHAFGYDFSTEKIIEHFKYCKLKRWIGANCWIIEPCAIFNFISERPNYFRFVEHSVIVPYTLRFPCFYDGNPTHFVLGQRDKLGKVEVIFDGWNPSAGNRGLKITNYRSFR